LIFKFWEKYRFFELMFLLKSFRELAHFYNQYFFKATQIVSGEKANTSSCCKYDIISLPELVA